MTVGQLLDAIRNRYLKQFCRCIAEVQKAGMEPMAEAAYRDEDGGLAREGVLSLPMRLDIVGFAEGEAKGTFRVDSDSMLSFEPIDFEWSGGLPTRLAPFHWDGCHIRAAGIRQETNWAHVRGWFDRWFDGEDSRQPDGDGLCGVIHFLSDPEHDGGTTSFEVDFGSAPEEAFEEFLDALRDSGATRIEIGYNHDG